jgi:hypothetical protein
VKRAGIVLLAWGAWLGVMTAVMIPFASIRGPFGLHAVEPIMLGGAAGACLVAGVVLWRLEARSAEEGERSRVIAEESLASGALVCGLCLALLGAGFGLWLILMGAGLTALGGGGLVREARARRREAEPR